MKTVQWRVSNDCFEGSEAFSTLEEAKEYMSEMVMENVTNTVLNQFSDSVKISENLEDILFILAGIEDGFKDWKITKETVEIDTLQMSKLRERLREQVEDNFRAWARDEENEKEAEERALLAELKAKYE